MFEGLLNGNANLGTVNKFNRYF